MATLQAYWQFDVNPRKSYRGVVTKTIRHDDDPFWMHVGGVTCQEQDEASDLGQ